MQASATRVPLLTAQAAAQASLPVDVRSYPKLTFYVTGTGTTSSGAISFEEADWDPFDSAQLFSGGWSLIGTALAASTLVAGAQTAVHLPAPAAYGFVRARISTVIGGGGTVTVALRANS